MKNISKGLSCLLNKFTRAEQMEKGGNENRTKPPVDSFFGWDGEEDNSLLSNHQESENGPEFRDFGKWVDELAARVPVLAQQLGKIKAAQIEALREMERSKGQISYLGVNSDEDDEVNPSVPLQDN